MDRYQPILDRHPFGALSASSTSAVPTDVSTTTPLFRLSALMDSDGGQQAGLVDVQKNRTLYLSTGQTEEGVTLLSVNIEKEEVKIQKEGQIFSLKMESGPPSASTRGPPSVNRSGSISLTPGTPAADAAAQERMRAVMERRRQILDRMRHSREGHPSRDGE